MKKWIFRTAGIPDDLFIRGEIPMTKTEVRAVIISKLRLKAGHIIYDIGAGTGSISVEAASQLEKGEVYAVERDKEGIELIKRNAENFDLENIRVIKGQAPEVLEGLPAPDRVVIGGSGGHLNEILDLINEKIKIDGRIVITAITINTLCLAVNKLGELNYNLDICNIAVTRTNKISVYHMFKAENPIYIITAERLY